MEDSLQAYVQSPTFRDQMRAASDWTSFVVQDESIQEYLDTDLPDSGYFAKQILNSVKTGSYDHEIFTLVVIATSEYPEMVDVWLALIEDADEDCYGGDLHRTKSLKEYDGQQLVQVITSVPKAPPPLKVVYAGEYATNEADSFLTFLAGPTPRDPGVASWRPDAIEAIRKQQLNSPLVLYVPEPRDGVWKDDYLDQVAWETNHMWSSDVVAFWIPRDLQTLPGFTTNVEFGMALCTDGVDKVYGRPEGASKTKYLDYLWDRESNDPIHSDLDSWAKAIADIVNWVSSSWDPNDSDFR